jgi:hypothetical protein
MAQRGNPQKGGEASLHSINVSSAELAMYIEGVDFPASKQDIIDTAKSNSAPENVMSMMNRLPDRTYNRPTEIEQEFQKIK